MKKYTFYLLCILVIMLLIGCKKEADTNVNTITWTLPEFSESLFEQNILYINQMLKDDGYDFQIQFNYLSEEKYLIELQALLAEGRTDIASLGLTNVNSLSEATPVTLVRDDLFLNLSDYLNSTKGAPLKNAFHDNVWKSVSVDGNYSLIPLQLINNGTNFIALNKTYFSEDIDCQGTIEEIVALLDSVDLPNDITPLILNTNIYSSANILGYEYRNGVFIDLTNGNVSSPFETPEFQKRLKDLKNCYEKGYLGVNGKLYNYMLPPDIEDDKIYQTIHDRNFAIWVDSDYGILLEEIKEDIILIQLPYAFSSITNGSTGISNSSKNQTQALEFLSLLHTNSAYSNTLINGKENIDYIINNDMIEFLDEERLWSISEILNIGVFDNLIPCNLEPFPINRKETKWSLYDTDAVIDSAILGFQPDLSEFNSNTLNLNNIINEYDKIWMEDDLDLAIEEAINACKESGSDKVIQIYSERLEEWFD